MYFFTLQTIIDISLIRDFLLPFLILLFFLVMNWLYLAESWNNRDWAGIKFGECSMEIENEMVLSFGSVPKFHSQKECFRGMNGIPI